VSEGPEVLDRLAGVCGELVLRRTGADFEIIANGVFLMDTRNGESERLMVTAVADRMRAGGRLLLAGLGVGFSLRAALDHARVGEVVVVERERAVIDWNHGPLRARHGDALADPRARCVEADLLTWLPGAGTFDGICLDIDNGPEWTVTDGNAALYDDSGLAMVAGALAPGAVLAVWSAGASETFAARLAAVFGAVETLRVPVPRGEPDVVFLAKAAGNPIEIR
jgi:spermidine synthase